MCKVIICGLILILCCSELNSNLWTSEDIITQEPTYYDNSDEQVSTFSNSKEAALGSQEFQLHDPKVNNQQGYWSSAEVHFIRSYKGGTQCHVKDDCSQTFPLKHYGCEEQGQSLEILESSISVRDVCLNRSESDQAETDFINFKSSKEENTNARVYDDGYPENMPFIDDNVPSVESSIATTNNSLGKQSKSQMPIIFPHSLTTSSPAHMACDSTQCNCFSVSLDSDNITIKAKTTFSINPHQSNSNKCAPLFGLRDSDTLVFSHSLCSKSIVSCNKYDQFFHDSQISKHSQPISDIVQTGSEFRTFLPITLDYECAEFFLEDDFYDRGPASPDSLNGHGCLDMDCRPFSPESETSQYSFSFLELFFSEPIRAQLMSQCCDYFLLYSGGKPSSRNSANASSPFNERLGEKSTYTQSVEKALLFTGDVHNRTHDKKSIHKEEKQKSVLRSGHCHKDRLVSPEPLKKKEIGQSFLDYWFSDLNQSSEYVQSPSKLENTLINIRQSSSEEKDSRCSCSGCKSEMKLNETCHIFEQLPKPVVFELVKRPKYILEFPNKISKISNGEKLKNTANAQYNFTLFEDDMKKLRAQTHFQQLNFCPENNLKKREVSSYMTFGQAKNQHCNYYLHYFEGMAVSPTSTLSAVEYPERSLEELFNKNRQDSLVSCAKKTTVPALFSAKPLTYADVVNGITHKRQEDSLLGGKSFELRPLKLMSETEWTCTYMEDCVTELRPQSPNSPVPQVRSMHRSFTPKSASYNWGSTDLCLDAHIDENIPQSTQSVFSDVDLDRSFGCRELAPETVSFNFDSSFIQDWVTNCRASSQESVVPDNQCSFCSCKSIDQVNIQYCDFYLKYSEEITVSPLSTLSDTKNVRICHEEQFDRTRSDLPSSRTSLIENNKINTYLPSSPTMPSEKPLTYADVVRGVTHKIQAHTLLSNKLLNPLCPSPLPSDKEFTDDSLDSFVTELRPQSPESVASQSEVRPLSPDSPVPQFRSLDLGYIEELSWCRSVTPESVFSDWEGTDLCLDTQFDETETTFPSVIDFRFIW